MSEILEIGDDGTFELPSPEKSKIDNVTYIEPNPEDVDRVVRELNTQSVFDSMSDCEYRVYREGNIGKVIVKLPLGQESVDINYNGNNEFEIKLDDKKGIRVTLPENLRFDGSKLQSTIYKSFLMICSELL